MFDLEYDELTEYAVAEVIADDDKVGYAAIGFVDATRDNPPLETGTKERKMSAERVVDYRAGNLHGKAIYVMSGYRSRAISRLQRIAGSRSLKHMAEETLLELPMGLQ